MTGITGLGLFAAARGRHPDLPALLLTGFSETPAANALGSAQGRLTVLLRKPIDAESLARHAARLRRRE